MNTTLLLDALLVLIVALFVPIGFWRGAAREAVVSGGILLGAAIASAWAGRWGDGLAAQTDLRQTAARFLVAAAALLVATFVLGYGGGVVLAPAVPELPGRLVGGLLAGLNGALLLGFALTFIQRYLLAGEGDTTLDDTAVARFLLREFGWVLVGGALVLVACVGAGLVLNRLQAETETEADDAAYQAASPPVSRSRPPRVPRAADAGKFEPAARGFDGRSGRFAADTPRPTRQATSPLTLFRPQSIRFADPAANGGGHAGESDASLLGANGGDQAGHPVAAEWLRRAGAMTRPSEPGPTFPTPTRSDPVSNGHTSSPSGGGRPSHCPVCGTLLIQGDRCCPQCGESV